MKSSPPSEADIHACIAQLLWTIDLGTSREILALHQELVADQELLLAVWEKMDAPFRRHWSGYLEDALSDLARETGSRYVLPCPD